MPRHRAPPEPARNIQIRSAILLAVDFRADRTFPTDDSGEGFDNIGDILTAVSPLLMDKYISAARTIAARVRWVPIPLPPKPIEIEYSTRLKNLRRGTDSSWDVEATHRVEFDAEYDIRFGLAGPARG